MFAIFNPGKRGKKRKTRRGKRRKTAYQAFVSRYFKTHRGATMKKAAGAWRGTSKHRAHKKSRRGKSHRCISKGAIPGVVRSAVRASVCNLAALQRARKKYCGIGAATLERAPSPDRLRSAAELGYRAVANNRRRR